MGRELDASEPFEPLTPASGPDARGRTASVALLDVDVDAQVRWLRP